MLGIFNFKYNILPYPIIELHLELFIEIEFLYFFLQTLISTILKSSRKREMVLTLSQLFSL